MTDNFEALSKELDIVLSKKKAKWLSSINKLVYMDFDDVSQIVKKHIFEKIHLYDNTRSFQIWASKVAESQIQNIIRNNYGKFSPPCNSHGGCSYNVGLGLCSFTKSGTQCSECPLYKKWENTKRDGYSLKFASPIEEVVSSNGFLESAEAFDMLKSISSFHEKMKEKLTPKLYVVYEILYIEQLGDLHLSKHLGLTNNEKNSKRVPGYKQIYNYKEQIMKIAREVIEDFDLVK